LCLLGERTYALIASTAVVVVCGTGTAAFHSHCAICAVYENDDDDC